MQPKFSEAVLESEQLLQEMLVKFFTQNSVPRVFRNAEHGAENLQRQEEFLSEHSTEDAREIYWAKRNANPNLYDIGSTLEWHLLANLMALNPGWRHDGWWCDGVNFLDVALHLPEPNILRGLAVTYWLTSDETVNKLADLSGYALADIELKLTSAGVNHSLAYSISLWADDHWYWFSETDFETLPLTSADAVQPDLSVVERIYQETNEDDHFSCVLSQLIDQFTPNSIANIDLSPQAETDAATLGIKDGENSHDNLRLPLPELLWWLEADNKKKARRAARGIGDIGPSASTAVPKLFSIVYDEEADTYLREACLEALIQVGLNENEALQLVKLLLTTGEWGLYSQIGKVLAQAGTQAISMVLLALKESSPENPLDYMISSSAFDYLKQQKGAALPAFLELLETGEWAYDALKCLHNCGAKAIPKLIELLNHQERKFRAAAAQEIGRIGEPDSVAIDALTQALDDPDPLVCVRAAEALGKLGAAALPALISTLQTNDKILLCWVVQSLGKLGTVAKPAVSQLRFLRDSNDSTVAYFATQSLLQIDNRKS